MLKTVDFLSIDYFSSPGGTVIGGKKIFCMKFADDLILTADITEGL